MTAIEQANEALRGNIMALEAAMAKRADVMVNFDGMLRHYFADGLYAREITIPAGMLLVGKIHRTRHICVVSKGDITVVTEEGMMRLRAPATIISPPGTKRAVYTHEETVWTVFHPTEETDLDKIEEMFIAPDYEALGQEDTQCLG